MKTPERFDRALKALAQAFFNDTLVNTDCRACAVGNMVATGKGVKLIKESDSMWASFKTIEGYDTGKWFEELLKNNKSEDAIDNILATGYDGEQLHRVERAFMEGSGTVDHGNTCNTKEVIMESQFNGLMAVVEVLCEIEGLNPEPYKIQFNYDEDFQQVIQTRGGLVD